MNFKFFIISILIISGLVGTAFAQYQMPEREFTEEEIEKMKNSGVLITMHTGTFTIELFPEDAPNTVYNFLNLVENGYYDGTVFHRIIPGFMIQGGDGNTKQPESADNIWGAGHPGYFQNEEFNPIKHNRGIVSMARAQHVDSAGSQFFIMHKDSPFLDGKYTAFGRLVPGTHSIRHLDNLAYMETNDRDKPLDTFTATIKSATILHPFSASGFGDPLRNESIITQEKYLGGQVQTYFNEQYGISFHLPYRWVIDENASANPDILLIMEPGALEHNVQKQIEQSGFTPQLIVTAEPKPQWEIDQNLLNTGIFSITGGDDPNYLANYIFTVDDGSRAHMMITTQNVETEDGPTQYKVVQIHFDNLGTNYSIIYVNVTEWFRYEVNAFHQIVDSFKMLTDGTIQPKEFSENPVYQQVITEAKEKPLPESLPPARIGGCLIATASYGSELAPQVQLLREIRDNTVLETQSGASFMNGFNHFYYSFSPTIADYERENPVFKEAVKLTLTPLLASLTLLQYADIDSEYEMFGYGVGIILLNIGMYFVAPAALITKIRSFYKLQ